MKANLYPIRIRRDAHTITPVTVADFEIPLLQTIFGEENIQRQDGSSLQERQFTAADAVDQVDVTGVEFDRLAAKYGENEGGLLVEQVYGKRASKGLENAIKANFEAAKKAPTKKADQE